jgi:hypothetical protein
MEIDPLVKHIPIPVILLCTLALPLTAQDQTKAKPVPRFDAEGERRRAGVSHAAERR